MFLVAKKQKPQSGSNQYRMIGVRPDDKLRASLEKCARGERRELSPMCIILLEEALAARGLYQRDDSDEPDDT